MREERREAVKFFIDSLQKEWDSLVEEAKKDVGTEDEDYIVYRYALLLFAAKHTPPPNSKYFKPFKKLLKLLV